MNSYAHALRLERKRLGLTQAEVAEACNLSRVTITQYESGLNTPCIDIVKPLSKLGFDMAFVLDLKAKTEPQNASPNDSISTANHELAKRLVARLPNLSKLPAEELNLALDSYLSVLQELSSTS